MDKYGFFVYTLTAVGVILAFINRKKNNYGILHYILLTAIIGGALFYLVWEAAGRYVLPYFIFALPYAAAGLGAIRRRR